MAGIEEAFEKFVTRVSSREEPQDEYGDPQTGEKRIPLMQGIKRGYDFENTMPNYYNQRYDYENQMPIYQDDRYNIPQQELMGGGVANGGVASMFRERPGYQEGGISKPALIEDFYKSSFYDPRGMGAAVIVPVTLPTGEKFTFTGAAPAGQFEEYLKSLGYSTNRGNEGGYNVIAPAPTVPAPTIPTPVTPPPLTIPTPVTPPPLTIPTPVTQSLTPATGLPVTTMPVTQPTAEAPINSLEKFIAERKFQAEADAAARSNIPFTKTFSDYLPTPTIATPTLTTNLEQNLISNNLSRLFPENNFYDSLRTNPITSNMQGIYNTSFNQRPINSAFSPTSILGSLESRMREFQPFANRLNLSQQDAAARVTPRIFGKDGGRVNMSDGGLTKTVPPVKGPDSQGVESLFRRRYN